MSQKSETIDLSKLEVLRGETPEDIKDKCFDLCKDYLGGVWLKVGIDEVEVKRLSGGFTNQLYYCAINKLIKPINDEPQEVAILLYGEKHVKTVECEGNERLSDVIITLLVSENKLGPKIYGLFESGQIQQYYKHRHFRCNEQKDNNLVKELATKLARVHSMVVPIVKTGNWILNIFDTLYENALKSFPINQLIEEYNCETFKKHDIKIEIEWIKKMITGSSSPIVFCHNDFHGANILVIEEYDENNTNDRLVFCDYEYSGYGYRGLDFGTIFSEWGRNMNDFMNVQYFPEDSVVKEFFEDYINESVRINGNEYSLKECNSMDQLIREAKIFTLVSNLIFVIYVLKTDETTLGVEFDKKRNMGFADICYKTYFNRKQRFIDEKLF